MSEAVRQRKRCIWCDPPHMMDDLGDVRPGDQLRDAFCQEAQARALGYIEDLGEKEQQALKGKLYTPADVAGFLTAMGEDDGEAPQGLIDWFKLEGPRWKVVLWWLWAAALTGIVVWQMLKGGAR